MKRIKALGIIAAVAMVFTACGYFLGQTRLSKANRVYDILDNGCIYSPGSDILAEGAADGLAKSVDDVYTQYLDSSQMANLNNMVIAAEEPGFGMEVVGISQGMKVVDVGELSPAEMAGLAPGDIIVEINGTMPVNAESFTGFNDGDRVPLKVMRSGNVRECTVAVKPTPAMPDVVSKDIQGVRYIRIRSFMQDDVVNQFLKALMDADNNIILDLRNNPGGRLEAGLAIAEMFIPKDEEVLGFEFSNSKDEYCSADGYFHGADMVILVDGYSASAAEIVAGSLKHYGYTVVGQPTFGKGLVQSVEEFSDGTGIKYTSAEYVLPGGEHINGTGVVPDVQCENAGIHGDVPGWGLDAEDDIQLQQALQILLNN